MIDSRRLLMKIIGGDVLPSGWEADFIENVADISTGNKDTQDRVEDGKYPFFVRSQKVERINSYCYDGVAVLTAGDGVGTGKVFHFINGKFDFHQRVYKISDFANHVDPRFFFEFFRKNFIRQVVRYTAKTSVDSVRMEMVAKMPIPILPLKKQKKIAAILATWDSAIERTEKLIQAKEKLKKGLMQQLLRENKRFSGFTEPWKEVKLGVLGSFSKGSGISKAEILPKGYPAITYGELYTTHHTVVKSIQSFINEESKQRSKRISHGNILFAGSGETADDIGKAAVFLMEEAYAGGDIIIFSPKKGNPLYLSYALNSLSSRKYLRAHGQGHSVVHIYKRDLEHLSLIMPQMAEQKKIAKCLSTIDKEIDSLKETISYISNQKRGLMQKLLTGQIRVNA